MKKTMSSNVSKLLKEGLAISMSNDQYYSLLEKMVAEGKSTGPNQSEAMANYSKLNLHRSKRIVKTTKLTQKLLESVKRIDRKQIWLVITESWCGDAAQSVPVFERAAAESENVELRYLLRDENLELMDCYLTDGGRAIPKIILIDNESGEELANWGARPAPAQELYLNQKANGIVKDELMESLQRWYNEDKQSLIQEELEGLLQNIAQKETQSV